MFQLQKTREVSWRVGQDPVPIITYVDSASDRIFMIRPNRGRYDIRITVNNQNVADQSGISAKQVEITGRTLGIDLSFPVLQQMVTQLLHYRKTRV